MPKRASQANNEPGQWAYEKRFVSRQLRPCQKLANKSYAKAMENAENAKEKMGVWGWGVMKNPPPRGNGNENENAAYFLGRSIRRKMICGRRRWVGGSGRGSSPYLCLSCL